MRLNRKRLRDALANVGVALVIAGMLALFFGTQEVSAAYAAVVAGAAGVLVSALERKEG